MIDMKKSKPTQTIAEEWDLSEGMGILPDDIPFTQNIGCAGGKSPKSKKDESQKKNELNK
ncbi:hypothetical protein D0X99_02155 [Algoriphagus lacus]|uniref:Uncharacterized protein n=2 Tax=Algoriphagus lacus TaxID=2056311 RepID=A0A418PWK5_9BACT|nr:hypothetical protein D0X99_02155 [Algoriphagus lacus]